MTINRRLTAALLELLQRAASQLEGDFGKEDGVASELRDMHRALLSQPQNRTREQMIADQALKDRARVKPRDKNGHFIRRSDIQ